MSVATYEPVSLSPEEQSAVRKLEKKLGPETAALVGPEGEKLELPPKVYQVLREAIKLMARGKAVTLVPDNQALTTQRAANILGMSRPFLIRLLESDAIPYHRVGTQRRVYLRDVLDYAHKRSQGRREALDRLSQEAFSSGLYDMDVVPEDASDS